METILQVTQLSKRYGDFQAVNDVSFAVPKGQVIGLLGPNGAGKTTTIHMLLGLTEASSGSIQYFGLDFKKHRQACLQRINFSSAFHELQGRISVWENLSCFAALYGLKKPKQKIMELTSYFEISDLLSKRFWDLSAGQRTRVNLVKSLLNDPELILMDEPTASLDPDIADKTINYIEQLRRDRALSLLYTSHDMEEVARLCDEVIFLDHGTIVAQDTPLGLTKRITTAKLHITFDGDPKAVEVVATKHAGQCHFSSTFNVTITTTEQLIPKLIFALSESGVWITDIAIQKPTLEDVFLQIARGKK